MRAVDIIISDPEGDKLGEERLQWLRDGAPISRATRHTYKLTAQDEGSGISVRVTPVALAVSTIGPAVVSEIIGPIRASTKVTISSVEIKGSPKVRGVLEAIPHYEPVKGVEIKYQWQRRKRGAGKISANIRSNFEGIYTCGWTTKAAIWDAKLQSL